MQFSKRRGEWVWRRRLPFTCSCVVYTRPTLRPHHSLPPAPPFLLFKPQTRVVAIFHAFTTMTLAYRLSFLCRPLEIGGVNTPGQDIVVNVAGGFFLYDLISWVIYGYIIAKYVERGERE